jgi:hypothetical protein
MPSFASQPTVRLLLNNAILPPSHASLSPIFHAPPPPPPRPYRVSHADDVVYQKRRPQPNASRTEEKRAVAGADAPDGSGSTASKKDTLMGDSEGEADFVLLDKEDSVGMDKRTHKLVPPEVRASALLALGMLVSPVASVPLPPPTVVVVEQNDVGTEKKARRGGKGDDDEDEDDAAREAAEKAKAAAAAAQDRAARAQQLLQHDPRKQAQLLIEYSDRLVGRLPRLRVARMHPTFAAAACDMIVKVRVYYHETRRPHPPTEDLHALLWIIRS